MDRESTTVLMHCKLPGLPPSPLITASWRQKPGNAVQSVCWKAVISVSGSKHSPVQGRCLPSWISVSGSPRLWPWQSRKINNLILRVLV